MAGIEFRDVARLLSCREFAEAEMTLRRGRAACPFHGGEHFNLQFFDDGRCYCHVCHQAADVVQLAAAVWHCTQMEAADALNKRFNLHLDGKTPTAAEADVWRHKRLTREDKQQAAEAAVEAAEAEARAAWAAVEKSTSTSGTDYDELQRQARNADAWLSFKRMELRILNGEAVGAGRC